MGKFDDRPICLLHRYDEIYDVFFYSQRFGVKVNAAWKRITKYKGILLATEIKSTWGVCAYITRIDCEHPPLCAVRRPVLSKMPLNWLFPHLYITCTWCHHHQHCWVCVCVSVWACACLPEYVNSLQHTRRTLPNRISVQLVVVICVVHLTPPFVARCRAVAAGAVN